MSNWLTLEDVKNVKGITSTNKDDKITGILPFAMDLVERVMPKFRPRQLVTDVVDGKGATTVVLSARPVCGIVSFRDDPSRQWDADSEIDADFYYVDKAAGVIELDYELDDAKRNVQTKFIAGYGPFVISDAPEGDSIEFDVYPVPATIIQVAADVVMASIAASGNEGRQQVRIGDFAYTLFDVGDVCTISPTAAMVIAQWSDGTNAL